ncbi:MAG: hypothetical protein M3452_06395 [Chloroflexota bacterium]|nr:hypothetical protein [Chloroflexota bacterium]
MVFAYLDAASGSLIIQALIAGLVAVPIFFRAQLSKGAHAVRRILGRGRDSSSGDERGA